MGDYEKLNSMDRDELLEFATFAYVSYPTLLETHLKRKAFHAEHPDKNPNRTPETENQLELILVQTVDGI